MKLAELTQGIGDLLDPSAGDLRVNHITHDSRKAQHGSMFVAIRGSKRDGCQFIPAAVQLGAVCVMTDQPEKVAVRIPVVAVKDARRAMAQAARRLYRYPDRELKVIGVTGTNGKTTFTYLVNQLLAPLGQSGRIGTLSYFNGVSEERALRTTPESSDIFRCLREMATNDCRYAAVEISSHGLMFDRVLGMELNYAVFTNLSRDHLDFHGDMETYFSAKKKQFDLLIEDGLAVINIDDPYGRRIEIPERAQTVYYGRSAEAHLRFEPIGLTINGADFDLFWQGRRQRCHIPLLGTHNIYNAAAAIAVALREGRTLKDIAADAAKLTSVPGRMEMARMGQKFGAIIDFAHTPDALLNVLRACKEAKPNRLLVVFGAGGDRDQSKRPEMGRIVDRFADMIYLTSDNPRHEDPDAIMDMVQEGIARPAGRTFDRHWDRRSSIERALNEARPGDIVLIAGKGHETTQEIRGQHHPFSDRQVALEILKTLAETRPDA